MNKIFRVSPRILAEYEYNITKETFDGKTMLEETAAILMILYRDYWASSEQRKNI